MSTSDPITAHRPYLTGLAYRMTGSVADADDVVQEAFLRWQRTDGDTIEHPRAWLTRVVTRLCLDLSGSARARREQYVGPWLPEPVVDDTVPPADRAVGLAEDVSVALLIAMERLSALERAAFLLREVFDWDYADVAAAIDRSEAACRQLVARARTHLREAAPRFHPTPQDQAKLLAAFQGAISAGDLDGLRAVLTEDAVMVTDGGGHVRAALRPIEGADRVARFILGVLRRPQPPGPVDVQVTQVHGALGLVVRRAGRVEQTVAFRFGPAGIEAVYAMRNPDKLRHVV